MSESTEFNTRKKAMLEALRRTLGVVTRAADLAGMERSTHYKWLDSDEDYKQAVEDMGNVALDFAESQLHALISEKNPAATIFYLKTKGKRRGYVGTRELHVVEPPKMPTWFTEADEE